MKILLINKFFYLRGGSERYLFDLADLLKSKGHEVLFFSMKDKKNFPTEYGRYFIDYVDLKKFSFKNIVKYFYNYQAAKNLKKLIRDHKPDIAHLNNIAHQISPSLIKVLKKNHIPMVMTLHDYKLICPNYKLYNKDGVCEKCRGGKYYQCLLNKCQSDSYLKSLLGTLEAYLNNKIFKAYQPINIFISPSQFLKDKFKQFGFTGEIKYLPNFINPINYNLKPEKPVENYILYFGRLSQEKGIDDLIEAFSGIEADCRLKIVGDGSEKAALEKLVLRKKLSSKIEFIGAKHGDELNQFIAEAKLIVIPSRWYENASYVVLEAMALGKAVIAASQGGLTELVKHNGTGLLYKAGDIETLKKYINYFLENPQIAEEMGKNAKQFVLLANDREKYYTTLINIYNSVIKV